MKLPRTNAVADGATPPDPALVIQLLRDTQGARVDGEISQDERDLLAADFDAVLESASIPQSAEYQAAYRHREAGLQGQVNYAVVHNKF